MELSDFQRMSGADIESLTLAEIADLQAQIKIRADETDELAGRLYGILATRYGQKVAADLSAEGSNFGTVHIPTNERFAVKAEVPKKVKWDQAKLREAVDAFGATLPPGEPLTDYVEFEVKISETKWKAWPPRIQKAFEAARTVKPEKIRFEIKAKT